MGMIVIVVIDWWGLKFAFYLFSKIKVRFLGLGFTP
jgi:hypothetical protein